MQVHALEVVLKEWQGSSQVSGVKCSLEAENISSYIRNRLEAAWLAQKVAVGEQREADEAELVGIKCREPARNTGARDHQHLYAS